MLKYFLATAIICFGLTPSAYGQTKTVIFESNPTGANVKLGEFESGFDILDGTEKRLFQTCVTPCSLPLTRSKYDVWIDKDGYSSVRYNWTDKSTDINQISRNGTVIKHNIVLLTEAQTKQRRINAKLRRACPEKYSAYQKLDNTDAVSCEREVNIRGVKLKKTEKCSFVYDIKIDGTLDNVRDIECSKKKLKKHVPRAISKWLFLPAKQNGLVIHREGVKSAFTIVKK